MLHRSIDLYHPPRFGQRISRGPRAATGLRERL